MILDKTILKATAIIVMLIASMGIQAAVSDVSSDTRIQRIEGNQSDSDLKPAIDSISDLTFHWDKYVFYLEFTVYYHGTNRINVCLEEENSSSLRDYDYNAPGKVQVKTGKLSRLDYCWVYIIAKNEYGSAERILEFPPHYPFNDSYSMEIVCDDISEDRTLSAYLPHTFKVENSERPISNPDWTLYLPLNDGGTEYLSLTDDGFSCTTDPIGSSSVYKIPEDGIMEAMLQFKGNLDDMTSIYVYYPINLDYKPFIEYAVIEGIKDEAPRPTYNAYYKVKYYGADKLRVGIEEEFGSMIRTSYVYEPYIAYGCAEHILAPYNASSG